MYVELLVEAAQNHGKNTDYGTRGRHTLMLPARSSPPGVDSIV